MNALPTPEPSWVPGYAGPAAGPFVYLCERCGQPLSGPHGLCNGALHVGSDGSGTAGAARAALGGWR
jgi:hypothetical protein